MANKPKTRVYVDSNILIPILKGREIPLLKGKDGPVEGPDRFPICRQILQDAKDGLIELYTSWATMTECVTPPTNETRSKIGIESVDDLFAFEFLIKCSLEFFVGTEARDIQFNASNNAEYQNKLKAAGGKKVKKVRPMDAMHVATAVVQEVDYFFTFDEVHLIPLSGTSIVSELKICFPYRPWDPAVAADLASGQKSLFESEAAAHDPKESIAVQSEKALVPIVTRQDATSSTSLEEAADASKNGKVEPVAKELAGSMQGAIHQEKEEIERAVPGKKASKNRD